MAIILDGAGQPILDGNGVPLDDGSSGAPPPVFVPSGPVSVVARKSVMTQIIALQPTPNQTLTTVLGNQRCRIRVYTRRVGTGHALYLDLFVNDAPVVQGVLCVNAQPMAVSAYLGFVGDLRFYDTNGVDDPVYTGLGTRWILTYA